MLKSRVNVPLDLGGLGIRKNTEEPQAALDVSSFLGFYSPTSDFKPQSTYHYSPSFIMQMSSRFHTFHTCVDLHVSLLGYGTF